MYFYYLLLLGSYTIDLTTVESLTKEIERILLRYNQQTKSLYKKYCEYSDRRRTEGLNSSKGNQNDKYIESWDVIEKVIFAAKGWQVYI